MTSWRQFLVDFRKTIAERGTDRIQLAIETMEEQQRLGLERAGYEEDRLKSYQEKSDRLEVERERIVLEKKKVRCTVKREMMASVNSRELDYVFSRIYSGHFLCDRELLKLSRLVAKKAEQDDLTRLFESMISREEKCRLELDDTRKLITEVEQYKELFLQNSQIAGDKAVELRRTTNWLQQQHINGMKQHIS